MPGLPVDEFSGSAAVFTGRVIGVSSNSNPVISIFARMLAKLGQYPSFFYRYLYSENVVTFEVLKSWKMVNTTRVTVLTGSGGGDCGFSFDIGSVYLVYAYHPYGDQANGLGASTCSRTNEITYATEDLSYLNTLPTLTLAPVADYSWLCWAGPAIVISISGIFFVLRWRQKRKLGSEFPS
jgi:hypothetical protein